MEIVPKSWGEELWIINIKEYCGKILTLNKGSQGSKHYHKKKDETFYILSGKIKLEIWNKTTQAAFYMTQGETIRIKPKLKMAA